MAENRVITSPHLARRIWTSRMVPGLTRRLGGPMGGRKLLTSGAWAYVLATLSWVICMLRQMPCKETLVGEGPNRYESMCYTDLTSLYLSRGQVFGKVPYLGFDWEYPVVSGYFSALANAIARLFGADLYEGIDGVQQVSNIQIYFAISAVGLFLCFLWLISSVLRIAPKHPVLAMIVAISPAIMTAGLINWDLLAIAFVMAGLAAWMEDTTIWAGFWWGLAISTKLYPILIVVGLGVLCLRRDSRCVGVLKNWLIAAAMTAWTWVLINLPVAIADFIGWRYGFGYTFNSSRGADLGSIWLVLDLLGIGANNPAIGSRVLILIGLVFLVVLIIVAPKIPSAPQIAYLAVAVFLVGNLVYSPQFVLWILPLIVLIRPKVADLVTFTLSELLYFCCIWWYLDGKNLSLGISEVPWLYILAILIRVGATLWVMSRVVRDVLRRDAIVAAS